MYICVFVCMHIGGEETADKTVVIVLAATNLPWELDEALRRRYVLLFNICLYVHVYKYISISVFVFVYIDNYLSIYYCL